MLNFFKKVFRQMFAFLSSVQLAVLLLLGLAAVLAVGTFYESSYDAETAKYYVYNTWWFAALLGVLGLNVFCAGLSRYPWKRHHTGFLVVHLGILIILLGSFITLYQGYEGQLIIPEGETRQRLFLSESSLYFYDTQSGALDERPAKFRFTPPTQENPFGGKVLEDVLVRVVDYLPNAQMETKFVEGTSGENPALQIALEGSRAQLSEWILARDTTRQRLNLGPASVTFIEVPRPQDIAPILKQRDLRGPVLWAEGKWIPLKGNLGKEIPLKGKTLTIKNLLPHAAVYQGQLVNRSEEPLNPVVQVTIRSGQEEQEHTVFAKFPELPTHHQATPSPVPVKLFWIPEELGTQNNELLLVKVDAGDGYFTLKNSDNWLKINKIKINEKMKTGWMDFHFTVSKVLNHAQLEKKFRRVAVPKGKQGLPPAIRIQLAYAGEFRDFWIGRGQSEDVSLGGRSFKVAYALKSAPLGFEVKLRDFKMGMYEGTSNPASYESEVTLIDEAQGLKKDLRIAMNQPLEHGKYKIFQASYQLNPDGPDWSVFSVAYDPGVPIKYVGSIILVLGIVIIFYFRKAYLKKPAPKPASQAKLPEANSSTGLSPAFAKRNS